MPEERAGRRAAVVRPAPEAGREPHRGGRARMPDGRRGGAERSPATTDDGSCEGGPGRKTRQAVHQAGRERRRGATPATATPDAYRTDLWNEPTELIKQAAHKACGREKKTPREDQQGRCRTWGSGKGRRRPCPSAEGKDAGGVTGLEQRNAQIGRAHV